MGNIRVTSDLAVDRDTLQGETGLHDKGMSPGPKGCKVSVGVALSSPSKTADTVLVELRPRLRK